VSCDLEDVKMLMGNRLDGVPQCVVVVCVASSGLFVGQIIFFWSN